MSTATAVRKTYDYQALVPPPPLSHVVLNNVPKRLIVVGDVHGCLEELQSLLKETNFNRDNGDEVLLVGDVVNKGPLSAETVQFARENGFHCIRGNHDDFVLCHALRLVDDERHPSLEYIDKLTQEDINWLTNLPYSISIPEWRTIFVHAGIVPNQPLLSQTPVDLVTIRNVMTNNNEYAAADSPLSPSTVASSTITATTPIVEEWIGTSKIDEGEPWVSKWNGELKRANELIFSAGNEADAPTTSPNHSHNPPNSDDDQSHFLSVSDQNPQPAHPTGDTTAGVQQQQQQQAMQSAAAAATEHEDVMEEIENDISKGWHVVFGHDARRGLQQFEFATGLDTGCAYGRQLTGLVLPERKIVQVQAKEVYSPVGPKD